MYTYQFLSPLWVEVSNGWVKMGWVLKNPIAHLGPFNKVCIAHTQPNLLKSNPPIYPIILCMQMVKISYNF